MSTTNQTQLVEADHSVAPEHDVQNPGQELVVARGRAAQPLSKQVTGTFLTLAELREVSATLVELARTHAEHLALRGWTPLHTDAVQDDLRAFDREHAAYLETCDIRERQTAEFRAIVRDTLSFRTELVAALFLATNDRELFADQRLHLAKTRRPSQLSLWFLQISWRVKEHRAALAPNFAGRDPVEILEWHQNRLQHAMGAQAVRNLQFPSSSTQMIAARQALVASLRRLKAAAKLAFARNSRLVLRQFRLETAAKRKPLPAGAKRSTLSGATDATQVAPGQGVDVTDSRECQALPSSISTGPSSPSIPRTCG